MFLALACDPSRPRIAAKVAIVLAHPDDETLGCGALLPRLDDVRLVHVTDGAPRNGDDARRHGFPDPTAYGAARRAELEAALALADIRSDRATCLGIADQAVAFALPVLARRLLDVMAGADVVLTHALEGGHPDHDGTAVAVRAAARLLGDGAPAIVEMPFYHADAAGDGWVRQRFSDPAGASTLRLTADERRRKLAMLAAHATQRDTLAAFGAADERFRPAVPVEAARVLGGGPALYDRYSWGVTSAEFEARSRAALQELGLAGPWL